MRRGQRSEYERRQDSVSYRLDESMKIRVGVDSRRKYTHELYPGMLLEDVRLGIMPIGGRARSGQFRVAAEPEDAGVTALIADALMPRHMGTAWLDAAVCDFVGAAAAEMLISDTVTFEISYLFEPATGRVAAFELVYVHPATLDHTRRGLVQRVPRKIAEELGKPEEVPLSPERVITFSLPARLRGKMDQMMESLALLSVPSAPRFFMEDLAAGIKTAPYDAQAHIQQSKRALASAVRSLGWNARLLLEGEALEYYLMHRELIFNRFKIEMRDNILETLNEGLVRAGEVVGFEARLVVEGLPTLHDVACAERRLAEGSATFEQILAPFRSL